MNTDRIQRPDQSVLNQACPFFDSTCQNCKAASLGNTSIAIQQFCYCETEDYDYCPLFLSRLLRNSRPKFRGLTDLALK